MTYRKKLIEVALPLEAINAESAREKSIRHGHPSTLHLWWARRPLAACRAVLWASLVDDPSSWPERFPTEEAQRVERERLFDILARFEVLTDKKGKTKQVVRGLVSWNDINNSESGVLEAGQQEIARCLAWERGEKPPAQIEVVREYIAQHAPPVYDPFAGGGSIPLEAQRLGLQAHASDLNPVAVLISKALIEIPPKFKDVPPVNPKAHQKLKVGKWQGTQGLAADVRYYGQWMRDEAFKRIGHLYPAVKVVREGSRHYRHATESEIQNQESKVEELTVIAWIWARMVQCSNPACRCDVPLTRSFSLSKRKGNSAHIRPLVKEVGERKIIKFSVALDDEQPMEGTINRKGIKCISCNTPSPLEYVREKGRNKEIDVQLMALVAIGENGRVFLSPSDEQIISATEIVGEVEDFLDVDIPQNPRYMSPPLYGILKYSSLFTKRQLLALKTFGDLVDEVKAKIIEDCQVNSHSCVGVSSSEYADGLATYLGLSVSKASDLSSSLCHWQPHSEHLKIAPTFSRHALSMSWDFAEGNPFSDSTGNFSRQWELIGKVIEKSQSMSNGKVRQHDATVNPGFRSILVSTDPPYYDNVPYADLSDFFYIWLRESLQGIYPNLFGTLLTPKSQELVADPYRHGSREKSQNFFENGLLKTFSWMRKNQDSNCPTTVYYAFKQAEAEVVAKGDTIEMVASTGWETMLEGLINSGFSLTGTWPVRTERSGRMRDFGSNALASSIVLVCRPRPTNAPKITRRQFLSELKRELPKALKTLQQGNVAPVDLAQASIGPGMAIYSRYTEILESDGSPMRVRTALQLINQILDEFLTEQEGEFDSDTRWALTWFEQHQFNEGQYGDAETLSKARNTSVQGLVDAGILEAESGKVRLLQRKELPDDWNPEKDSRTPDWELTQHLISTLETQGETGAAELLAKLGSQRENARDLAYRLYNLCDRKGWSKEALAYNSLVIAWPTLTRLANEIKRAEPVQTSLDI